MPDERLSADVRESQVYDVLASLVMHSEQVRWTRLSNLLVVNSILVVAWAAVFAGTSGFPYKPFLLTLLCLPGTVFGVLWAFLGSRSSKYLDDFHNKAEELENGFPEQQARPFQLSEETRKTVRKGSGRFTTSKWIVTWIPVIFSLLFLGLGVASWLCDPM